MSVLIAVFLRDVVLRTLPNAYFPHIGIGSILYPCDSRSLEGLSLFHKFFDAFRVDISDLG
jgi:hypothetical protein